MEKEQKKAWKINILVRGKLLTYTTFNYSKTNEYISFYDKFGYYVEYHFDSKDVKLVSIEQTKYKVKENRNGNR